MRRCLARSREPCHVGHLTGLSPREGPLRAGHDRWVHDLPTTVAIQLDQAHHKVTGTSKPIGYLVSAMLAGAYVGIAVVLMVSTAGPFLAAGESGAKLVSGAVFAVALTLVVFAGAELSTSAMMILPQGALMREISWGGPEPRCCSASLATFSGRCCSAGWWCNRACCTPMPRPVR